MIGLSILVGVTVAVALCAGGVDPVASTPGDCPYISTPWTTPYGDRDCDGFFLEDELE